MSDGFVIPISADASQFIATADEIVGAMKELFATLRSEAAKGMPLPQQQQELSAAAGLGASELGRLHTLPGSDLNKIGTSAGEIQAEMDATAKQLKLNRIELKDAAKNERYAQEKLVMATLKASNDAINDRLAAFAGRAAREAYFKTDEGKQQILADKLKRAQEAALQRHLGQIAQNEVLQDQLLGTGDFAGKAGSGPDPTMVQGRARYLEDKFAKAVALSQEGHYTEQDKAGAGALAYLQKKRAVEEARYAEIALNADKQLTEASGHLAALRARRAVAEGTAQLRYTTDEDLLATATLAVGRERQRLQILTLQENQVTTQDIAAQATLASLKTRHAAQKSALVAKELQTDTEYIAATVEATLAKRRTASQVQQGVLAGTTNLDLIGQAANERDTELEKARKAVFRGQVTSDADTKEIGRGDAAKAAQDEAEKAAKLSILADESNEISQRYNKAKAESTVNQERVSQLTRIEALALRTEADNVRGATLFVGEKRAALVQQIHNLQAMLGIQQQEIKSTKTIAQLEAQQAFLQKQMNTAKGKELATLNKEADVNSGQGVSAFQRLQAFLKNKGSSRDNPVDASEQQRLGQFLGSKALTTGGFAVTGFVFYRGAQAISEMVKSSIELERQLSILKVQFEDTDGAAGFDKARKTIFDISTKTGESAEIVGGILSQMKGAFGTAADEATLSITKIATVTGISSAEAVDSITAIAKAFDLSGTQLNRIGDLALGVQARYGVQAKETIAFLGDIAAVGKEAGFSLEQLTTIAGVAQQRTGRSGSAIAEALNRVLPEIQSKATKLLAVPGLKLDTQNLATGQTGKTFLEILRQYQNLSSPSQKSIVEILGGPRQAQAIIPVLQQGQQVLAAVSKTKEDAGRTDKAYAEVEKSLALQIARLREEFKKLAYAIYQAGLDDILKGIVSGVSALVHILEIFSGVAHTVDKFTLGMASSMLKLYAALKLISAIGKFGIIQAILGTGAGAGAGAVAGEAAGVGILGRLGVTGLLTKFGLRAGATGTAVAAEAGGVGAATGLSGMLSSFLASPTGFFAAGGAGAAAGGTLLGSLFLPGAALIGTETVAAKLGLGGGEKHADVQGKTKAEIRNKINQLQRDRSGVKATDFTLGFGDKNQKALEEAYAELYSSYTDSQLQGAYDALKNQPHGTSISDKINIGPRYKSKSEIRFKAAKSELEDRNREKSKEDWISRIKAAQEAGVLTSEKADEIISGLEAGDEDAFDDARKAIYGIVNNDAKNAKYGKQRAKDRKNTANDLAVQAQLQDLDSIRNDYEEGSISFQEYVAALDKSVTTLGEIAAGGREEDIKAWKDTLKERRSVLANAAKTSAETAISLGEATGQLNEANGDRVKILLDLLANPNLTPQEREQQSSAIVQALKGELQAKLNDPSLTAAQKQTIARKGIKIPPAELAQLAAINAKSPNATLAQYLKSGVITLTPAEQADLDRQTLQESFKLADAQSGLAKANLAGDSVGLARQAVKDAKRHETEARALNDQTGIVNAQAEQVTAAKGLEQALSAIQDARDNLANAVLNDPVRIANNQLATAQRHLSEAKTEDERIKAQIEVANAVKAQQDSVSAVLDSQNNLAAAILEAAGDSTGAIKKRLENLQRLKADAIAKGAGDTAINNLEAQIVQTNAQLRDTEVARERHHEQFLLDTNKITKGQYIAYLEGLLNSGRVVGDAREDLEAEIYRLKQELSGDTAFNTPTSVPLPTLYEARRLTTAGTGSNYDQRQVNVTMYINNGMDEQGASQFLADSLGSRRYGTLPRSY